MREQVLKGPVSSHGHYIALVLWQHEDFHFFRQDADGTWSQKRGDTFVTNTYPNRTVITDVEDPAILGAYRDFCGYFHVNPDTHFVQDSYYAYQQSIMHRLVQAEQLPHVTVNVTRLPHPSQGWMRLSYPYYMFGLDMAVFEQGQRPLPWQGNNPSNLGPVNVYKSAAMSVSPPALPRMHTPSLGNITPARPGALIEPERAAALVAMGVSRRSGSTSGWGSSRRATTPAPTKRDWANSNGARRSSRDASSRWGAVRPHWMSRIQQEAPEHQRDNAIRAAWQRTGWHRVGPNAVPSTGWRHLNKPN